MLDALLRYDLDKVYALVVGGYGLNYGPVVAENLKIGPYGFGGVPALLKNKDKSFVQCCEASLV